MLEVLLGAGLLQSFLIQLGIEDAMPERGVARLLAALFLAVEGVLRFAIATQGSAVASLPVILVWRAARAIGRLGRRERRGSPLP